MATKTVFKLLEFEFVVKIEVEKILWDPGWDSEAIFSEITKTEKIVWNICYFFRPNFEYLFPRDSGLCSFGVAEFKSVIKTELVWFSKWGD